MNRATLQEYLNEQKNDVVEEVSSDSGGAADGGNALDPEKELREIHERRKDAANSRYAIVEEYQSSTLSDMAIVKPLGKGSFGNVFLVDNKVTHSRLALKCLDKSALVDSNQHQYVRREVGALQNFNHPFIGEYFGVVVSPRKIFFMLEYIPGGELWSYIYKDGVHGKGVFGGIDALLAAYYGAIVFMAIEHIHTQGYAYRDLKPENLLICQNGYLKIVDFGFAKQVPFLNKQGVMSYRTFTLCGTPDYMAPEVVLTQGHDKSADYWALGVLIYELLCGNTPFEGRNQQRTFEKIVNSQKHLSFPKKFEPHAKSLLRRLLHPNAALRLGALQNGGQDVREHAFFTTQNIDFNKLLHQEIDMSYKPKIVSDADAPTNGDLDMDDLDLNAEMIATVDDEYESYFGDLHLPQSTMTM